MSEDSYHDDPIEEPQSRSPRTLVVTTGAFILGALLVFQGTFASNIALNSDAGVEFGQGIAVAAACSGNTNLRVAPTASFANAVNAGSHYFKSVSVTNIPTSCRFKELKLSIYDDSKANPETLFGAKTSINVFFNSNVFYTSAVDSNYVMVDTTTSDCSSGGGTCYGFTATFINPSLLSSKVGKLVIQSQENSISLTCLQSGNLCVWERADSLSTFIQWNGISASSDGTKQIACMNANYVYVSTNSGSNWTQTSLPFGYWSGCSSNGDGTKLAAGLQGGYIYTSDDSGATWTPRPSSGSRNWQAISSSYDGTKLAAIVVGGCLCISTDSGVTWTDRSPTLQNWFSIASSSDGTKLAVVTWYNSTWTSADSGVTWIRRDSAPSGANYSIASSSDGTRLAIASQGNWTDAGYIWTSTDSGATWTSRESAGLRPWTSIASSSDGRILGAVALEGNLWTSIDSGATWTNQTESLGPKTWNKIISTSGGTNFFATSIGNDLGSMYRVAN